jgi:hypothetical protein
VSCTTATACMGVGQYTPDGTSNPLTLAESWNGASWTISATPNPSDEASFDGVSCVHSTCVAVGQVQRGVQQTLAERGAV